MARPSEALLNKPLIISTALALIEKHGLQKLSMRRLASALEVSAPSLYYYYDTKDDLLADVVRQVLAESDSLGEDSRDWDEALEHWARGFHRALSSYPATLPLLSMGPGRWLASLEQADKIYSALRQAGWTPRLATEIAAAVRSLVVGAASGSFAASFSEDPQEYEQHPHLDRAHLLAAQSARIDEEAFELGLNAMLTGLRQVHAQLGLQYEGALKPQPVTHASPKGPKK